jgi:hypothetical protein
MPAREGTSRPRSLKPAFNSVVDLGLRDVGVRNQPRRLAAEFGKTSVWMFALVVVIGIALCAVVRTTGAGHWLAVPFALATTGGALALAVRNATRAPILVVRVTADGPSRLVWLVIAPFPFLALTATLAGGPLLIPTVAFAASSAAILTALARRGRGRVPEALRTLRPLLGAEEPVLGDGMGAAPGSRSELRVVAATDKRVLVVASQRPGAEPFLLLDLPYERLAGFAIDWRYRGRIGELSLKVAGAGDTPGETHVVTTMVPANLLSIARALHSHGVPTDDPELLAEAERGWEEARSRPAKPRPRLLDRAAMNTRAFDRGLWLLLGLSAFAFYLNPSGIGLGSSRQPAPALLVVAVVCLLCGYLSGTRSSLAYLVPLNLLVVPAFFFWYPSYVIGLMVVLSAYAAICLLAGWGLRELTARLAGTPDDAPSSPEPRPPRGSLREAIGGPGLVRLTRKLLVAMLALVVVSSITGFELTTLRLAIDEATANQVPVDGRSNLTGGVASVAYTPGPDLHEFITDQHRSGDPRDGARWELRSSWTQGHNVVSLASYIEQPFLTNKAAIANFVARKDYEHTWLAGFRVTHTTRVVDGRTGYVWNHRSHNGYWYYAAWFPRPLYSVRVECIAKKQADRFKHLCGQAVASLRFR